MATNIARVGRPSHTDDASGLETESSAVSGIVSDTQLHGSAVRMSSVAEGNQTSKQISTLEEGTQAQRPELVLARVIRSRAVHKPAF